MNSKQNRISWIYQILFWVIYFSFNTLRWGLAHGDFYYSLKSNILEFSLHITIVYVNLYFLYPKFILRGRFLLYVIYFLILLTIVYVFKTELTTFLTNHHFLKTDNDIPDTYTFPHIVGEMIGEIYVVAFVTAIKISFDWSEEKNRLNKLQKEHLKTELSLLKHQIEPHFFFNTLNNLYSLALIKSEKTPEVILKLSEIMRYVLYEVNTNFVPLEKEFAYLNNYIALEKLRHDKLKINVNYNGNFENVKIPPLIFFTYTENSFKHGGNTDGDFYINIDFELINPNKLMFSIENNYIKDGTKRLNSKGIGIKNSKRRLDLLYKDNYLLKIFESNQVYKVYLEIPV